MPELKFVINDPKTGKSYSKVHEAELSGIKIGDKVSGNIFGLNDFEFQFTGGSDHAGFPMRKDINSPNRKSALLGSGSGVHIKRKGLKLRKTVRGNTVGNYTKQINLKIIKQGKQTIDKALGIETKEKQPPLEKKEEVKIVEKSKEEKVEEKPKIEPSKEEANTEDKVKEEPVSKNEVKEEIKTP